MNNKVRLIAILFSHLKKKKKISRGREFEAFCKRSGIPPPPPQANLGATATTLTLWRWWRHVGPRDGIVFEDEVELFDLVDLFNLGDPAGVPSRIGTGVNSVGTTRAKLYRTGLECTSRVLRPGSRRRGSV